MKKTLAEIYHFTLKSALNLLQGFKQAYLLEVSSFCFVPKPRKVGVGESPVLVQA
jgi:hypothetical protein